MHSMFVAEVEVSVELSTSYEAVDLNANYGSQPRCLTTARGESSRLERRKFEMRLGQILCSVITPWAENNMCSRWPLQYAG